MAKLEEEEYESLEGSKVLDNEDSEQRPINSGLMNILEKEDKNFTHAPYGSNFLKVDSKRSGPVTNLSGLIPGYGSSPLALSRTLNYQFFITSDINSASNFNSKHVQDNDGE